MLGNYEKKVQKIENQNQKELEEQFTRLKR